MQTGGGALLEVLVCPSGISAHCSTLSRLQKALRLRLGTAAERLQFEIAYTASA